MKYIVYVTVASIVLIGCGQSSFVSMTAKSCMSTLSNDGSTILIDCGNTSYSIPAPQKGDKGDTGATGPQGQPGNDGKDGQDATLNPLDIVAVLDPCGKDPGVVNEVFLKLRNGQVIASFSNNVNGDYTRFSILPPGNYMTTDNTNCTFTLTADGSIVNESHHTN